MEPLEWQETGWLSRRVMHGIRAEQSAALDFDADSRAHVLVVDWQGAGARIGVGSQDAADWTIDDVASFEGNPGIAP